MLRVDFNVPLDGSEVRDDTRIQAALPTIKLLLSNRSRLVIASHLGRPGGKPNQDLRMDPVAARLSELIERPVTKLDSVVGESVNEAVADMREGDVILLENLRFEKGEEQNEPSFSKQLADPVELFVNDAFGTAHRAHASTVGVTNYLPAVAGLLMIKEIEELSRCIENPGHPLTFILGGAKISDKINIVRRFLKIADTLLIGGGIANTFLAARGFNMKSSLYEKELLNVAAELVESAKKSNCQIVLPSDLVVTKKLEPNSDNTVCKPDSIIDNGLAVDIGPETVDIFSKSVMKSDMIIWNGPLGVFEIKPYHRGTEEVARSVAMSSAYSVGGGGDLIAALNSFGLSDDISFISTGGGATLEFWEGKELPGIAVLQNK